MKVGEMTNHLIPNAISLDGASEESYHRGSNRDSLLSAIAKLHSAFANHRAINMSKLFREDAILMFPGTQDIVGRESIQEALVDFMTMYTTLSFETSEEFIDIGELRATYLAKFIEIRTPLNGEPTEKVYGRLLEIWELSSEGKWGVIRMMTGRYSETEFLQ